MQSSHCAPVEFPGISHQSRQSPIELTGFGKQQFCIAVRVSFLVERAPIIISLGRGSDSNEGMAVMSQVWFDDMVAVDRVELFENFNENRNKTVLEGTE